jgi:hypothetical protein
VKLARYVSLAVLVLLSAGFVYARAFMYQGVPWDEHRGSGIVTLERGTLVRTLGLRLDGNGLTLQRNESDRSWSDDERVTWRLLGERQAVWDFCGTGKDDYVPTRELIFAGMSWKSGQWVSCRTGEARPHFCLTSPHWLNASVTGGWPALALVTAVRRRLRFPAGHCQSCGYDLRATPERCPECGAAATR